MYELTDGQKQAFSAMEDAVLHYTYGGVTVVNGFSGTGKSTTISYIYSLHPKDVILLAPTGKAAARLRELTGGEAQTIHSFIYAPVENKDGSVSFKRREVILDNQIKAVIVDEASMINSNMLKDLYEVCAEQRISVILIGDAFQLPPVKDEQFSVFKDECLIQAGFTQVCQVALTDVVRQAQDNPIIKISMGIREGRIRTSLQQIKNLTTEQFVDYVKNSYKQNAFGAQTGTIITRTNDVRQSTNKVCRKILGHTSLTRGEPLMVFHNAYNADIYNGDIVDLLNIGEAHTRTILSKRGPRRESQFYEVSVHRPDGQSVDVVVCEDEIFGNLPSDQYMPRNISGALSKIDLDGTEGFLHCQFGYAITGHKSQASEWDNVVIIEKDIPNDARWLYTVVTRARKNVYLF